MQPDRVNSAVRDFLKRHLLDADCFCREELLDRFLSEMETVRKGGAGSVKMIPAWIGHPVPIRKPGGVLRFWRKTGRSGPEALKRKN